MAVGILNVQPSNGGLQPIRRKGVIFSLICGALPTSSMGQVDCSAAAVASSSRNGFPKPYCPPGLTCRRVCSSASGSPSLRSFSPLRNAEPKRVGSFDAKPVADLNHAASFVGFSDWRGPFTKPGTCYNFCSREGNHFGRPTVLKRVAPVANSHFCDSSRQLAVNSCLR